MKNCKINQTTKINLNKEKHILQKQINKKCLDNKSSITEEQLKEIENSNYNQRMDKAIKQLNIKHKTPPPPYTKFQLTSYHKEKFNKSITATQQKQENQTHINVKITNSEVNSAIKSLKNNRSPGYDIIVAEMMKILSSTTIDKLTHIINTTINNKQLHQLGLGILLPIPKHNKTKKVENARPIILLSTIRKIISLITLNRLRPTIENYLSPSQTAYRKGRSIEDIVWTLKLEIASTLSTNNKITILIEPASQIVVRRRWQILGHILPMDDLVPAKQSTINCFKKKNAKRGRPSTSLFTTIKHDLKAHKLNRSSS